MNDSPVEIFRPTLDPGESIWIRSTRARADTGEQAGVGEQNMRAGGSDAGFEIGDRLGDQALESGPVEFIGRVGGDDAIPNDVAGC